MLRACVCILAAAFAATAMAASAADAPAAAPAANAGVHLVKLTNTGRSGISAVYVSKAGSQDSSDDLLGRQTADPGKTVTLKVKDPEGSCMFDLQFLMNDGSTVTRSGVNLCQTAAYPFSP